MRLLLTAAAWVAIACPVIAQDAAVDSPTELPAELPGANVAAVDAVPTLEPVAASAGLLEQTDGLFAAAVDRIGRVLFYRLFKRDQQVATYERAEPYIRTAGTLDDFRPLDQTDPALPPRLNIVELAQLNLEGRLVAGTAEEPEFGRVNGGGVDYLLVAFANDRLGLDHGDRYVLDEATGVYRRDTGVRGQLSESDTLPVERVRQLASAGVLTLDTESVGGVPVIVAWLAIGAVFFTIRMRLVNIWAFPHAVQVVRGRYDDPNEAGEVTHAQALASALSATVGLGNISGVTVAMTLGGPGAFFWMLMCGFFGMASKFVECTLAQRYRDVDSGDGSVLGGPMRYLRFGLAELGLGPIGRVLAGLFAVMCVLASFGGGNMFQANQSAAAVMAVLQDDTLVRLTEIDERMAAAAAEEDDIYSDLRDERRELQSSLRTQQLIGTVGYGLLLAAAVALVIVGGIKRIGATASKIVPAMCGLYLAACLFVILKHIGDVPALAASIFTEAFTGAAVGGGLVGALTVAVVGVTRAAFSNEAGVGSAAIAHSAAKTSEPVREGCVALLGPFIDTIVVCSMTALVILITNAWDNQTWIQGQGLEGAALTSKAFGSELSWFPYVLAVATVLFAFSTIISWSYYGEKATQYLLGRGAVPYYKALAVACVLLGAIVNLGAVLDFSDMMILCMAFPNILGAALLSGKVRADMLDYWRRLKAGEFETFDTAANETTDKTTDRTTDETTAANGTSPPA